MYDMVKNLHIDTHMSLLTIFNRIWAVGYLPCSWKEAIVVPVLKQRKDPSLLTNYRPIALASCPCKLFKKMINGCLLNFLESSKMLDPYQCGFREGWSTTDHLVRIEANIRNTFVHKQFFLSIFFDMENAYDTTWCFRMLRDLSELGIRRSMPTVIESCLSNPTFQVRIGNALSRCFIQESEVPLGGVLSCTLFIVKMNSLQLSSPCSMFYLVYIDGIQIGFRSCNLAICERQVQLGLNRVSKWAGENGFKLNLNRSSCILFT